jgi:hypothetical protein
MLSTIVGVILGLAGVLGAVLVGLTRSQRLRDRASERALGAAMAAERQRRMAMAEALGPRDRDDVVRELRRGGF